jgi:hypothetical protein
VVLDGVLVRRICAIRAGVFCVSFSGTQPHRAVPGVYARIPG